jgi:hypothetical protein
MYLAVLQSYHHVTLSHFQTMLKTWAMYCPSCQYPSHSYHVTLLYLQTFIFFNSCTNNSSGSPLNYQSTFVDWLSLASDENIFEDMGELLEREKWKRERRLGCIVSGAAGRVDILVVV